MSKASQIRKYDPAVTVVFIRTKEQFGGLSNMAPGFPLRINQVQIRTLEALYQACRFPHLPDVQRRIIDEPSPMTAKMRSKPLNNASRPDWSEVRVKIMRWCLRVKLAQNWTKFSRLLLSTGDLPIVERSRRDNFWGATMTGEGFLVGKNVLGRLLMELREQLKGEEVKALWLIQPLAIPEFLLFQQPIEMVRVGESASLPVAVDTHSLGRIALQPRSPSRASLFDPPQEAEGQLDTHTNLAIAASVNKVPKSSLG